MEILVIIYTTIIIISLPTMYMKGKKNGIIVGKEEIKDQINDMTVREMLHHKRNQLKDII